MAAVVNYSPPWWVNLLHRLPHFNLQFEQTSSDFRPEDSSYQQVTLWHTLTWTVHCESETINGCQTLYVCKQGSCQWVAGVWGMIIFWGDAIDCGFWDSHQDRPMQCYTPVHWQCNVISLCTDNAMLYPRVLAMQCYTPVHWQCLFNLFGSEPL